MTKPLTITIPMTPPHELSPNASTHIHPGKKTRLRGEWQRAWYLCAYQALYEARHGRPLPEYGSIADSWKPALFTGPVRCAITVYRKKGAKPWDGDNLLAAMKHGIDQLQTVGIVANDRQLVYEPIGQERDPDGCGFTVVTITPIPAPDALQST